MTLLRSLSLAVLAATAVVDLHAKPIAFADGTTVMHERNTNMLESQAFYAPAYWWSVGPGFLRLTSDNKLKQREISYLQANYLVKRWNMPAAQANVFTYGGIGTVRSTEDGGRNVRRDMVFRYGGQADFETRSIYTSFKADGYKAGALAHRITTAQLGVAPYEHDYEDLATWFLVQLRHYSGGIRDDGSGMGKFEQTLLLRLFKGPVWAELGINRERHSQFMMMYNF